MQANFPQATHTSNTRATAIAWAVTVLAILCTAPVVWHMEMQDRLQARTLATDVATDHARNLQRAIEQAMSANKALSAAVVQTNGSLSAFEETALHLLEMYPSVSAMSLAPAGIVRAVVPLGGNENALGFNVFDSPEQFREAVKTRDSGQNTVTGPMPLAQGGEGIIGRQPIFLEPGKFWGFANVAVPLKAVLQMGQLERLGMRGYEHVLWRSSPNSMEPQIIHSSGIPLASATIHLPIELPNSEWMLSVHPRAGWTNTGTLLLRLAAALVFAAVTGIFTKLLLRLKHQEASLEGMVNQRTAELQDAQRELRATIEAIPDVLMELNAEGRYINLHAPRADLLLAPRESLIGKSISDLLPDKDSAVIFEALRQAEEKGWAAGFLLQVPVIGGHTKWFELSVSRKTQPHAVHPRYIGLARDVTERVQAERDLRLTSQVFRQSSEAIVISDSMHRIVQVNPAYGTISGIAPEDAIGQPASLDMVPHSEAHAMPVDPYQQVLRHGQWSGETQGRHTSGRMYLQHRSVTALRDEQGRFTHCITLFRDITQQRQDQEHIRHLAHFDPLTGLPNRTQLSEKVLEIIHSQPSDQAGAALLFLDLDHFKNINDSLGHRLGDKVLIALARRLEQQLGPHDMIARMGGDEFVVLAASLDASHVQTLAQKLLDSTTHPFQIDDHELTISLSIGIATYPADGNNFDTLYQRADAAMYRAKEAGRNCFSFFTSELEARTARTLRVANALRRALEREQFSVVYQPQFDAHTRAMIGAEALIRWHHPELGHISPAEFIPIAENTGLIIPIGDWVMRTAVGDMRRWLDAGMYLGSVSVNLSPLQFQHHQLPEQVARNLQQAGLPPEHLMLELTESAAVDDPTAAIAMLDKLHAQGVRIALDDFGTGYSSLSYLKRFQLHKLKIDQSFVRDLEQDANDRAIILAIIHIAQALGMSTLAEGVETEAQLAFLREHGCDYAQGYLLSKPLPREQFEKLLRETQAATQE